MPLPVREKYITHVTIIGAITNILLIIVKFTAGTLGHSSAMIADAIHSLSDFISDVIILLCIRISGKPCDRDHNYGHGKFETIASVIVALFLLLTGAVLFYQGVIDILEIMDQRKIIIIPDSFVLYIVLLSLCAKEILYHYTIKAAAQTNSSALKTNAWHHRSDAFSSIAAAIGIGGTMISNGKYAFLDPAASCIISLFIIGAAWPLLKTGVDELLEKSLPETDVKLISEIIVETPGVISCHHLQTRKIGLNKAVDVHVQMNGFLTLIQAHAIASIIEEKIRNEMGNNTHIGIHMEPLFK